MSLRSFFRIIFVRRPARALVVLILLGGALAQAPLPEAQAAPLLAIFTVNTTADTVDVSVGNGVCADAFGNCSLRAAINEANFTAAADTITLPAGTYQLTLANAGGANEDSNATGDLDINSSMTIVGAGAGSTIIQAGTNTSNGIDKVLGVNPFCTSNVNVTIDGVTIRFGYNTQPAGDPMYSFTGGGLDWCGGAVGPSAFTLRNSVVSDNTNVNGYGGGLNVDSAGGTTTVTIENVDFINNRTLSTTTTATGGGLNIYGAVAVNISNSTFQNNLVPSAVSVPPGASNGGAINFLSSGSLSINGTIFSGNSAAQGGAVYSVGSTASIQHSQFTGNTATTSGGAFSIAGGTADLNYNRIVGNSPASTALNVSGGAADATENWWGCSNGPSATPCDRTNAAAGVYTPWLRDLLTSSAGTTLVTNQTSSLTASFLTNSSGGAVAVGNLTPLIGQPVTWNNSNGAVGSLSGVQATVQASGTATGDFQATGFGTAVIYARVDNDHTSGAYSNVLNLTINKADTTTAITSDVPDPSTLGSAVTVAVTVTGQSGNTPTAPTGTVTVSDGVDICTITLPDPSCSLTLNTLGARTITATYSGDDNFNGSTSTGEGHTVNLYPTTTAITGDTPDPSVIGQAVTFSYAVTPGGPGTPTGNVTVSNGTDSCTGTVADGACSLTFTTPGTTDFTATYAGDATFAGSTSLVEPHTVDQAATTTTLASDDPDPSTYGQVVTFSYTVSVDPPGVGTPTGSVFVSNGTESCMGSVAAGACTITYLGAGTSNFAATYLGDTSFAASTSADETHTVDPADTTTAITSDVPDSSQVGEPVTVSYTVTAVAPGAGTPAGNVTVTDGTDSCTGTVAAGSCTIAFASPGSKTLTAAYAGGANFGGSTSPGAGHTVWMASTTIAITSHAPDPSVAGVPLPVTFTVTVLAPGGGTPTGTVTVTDGVNNCTVPVAAGACNLTMTTVGGRLLTASYSGDANYGGSVSLPVGHTVQGPPAVTLINSNANTGDGQIAENEHTSVAITQLLVVFNKDMNADTPGDLDDVLAVANYSLVLGGSTVIPINGVITYNAGTHTATLDINGGAALPDGEYTLTVLGRIEDTLGAPIGTNFVRHFYVDSAHPHHTSIITLPDNRAITSGAVVTVRFSSVEITFDEELNDAGGGAGPDDVTNPQNYLLITPGLNGTFDTSSCTAGLTGDDLQILTGPVTYDDNAGTGPFVATVQFNGGTALPVGAYRLFVCGTTSLVDLAGNPLNGGADSLVAFNILDLRAVTLPSTGFAPDRFTWLPDQPADMAYAALGDLWLEVPRLGVQIPIVGVPVADGTWDVTWLGSQAGWLNGTAFPTTSGNAVLTGHVYLANGTPGPFVGIQGLTWGDQIIVHAWGVQYIYEVRSVWQVLPDSAAVTFKHEELPWLTLVTCKGFDEASNSYRFRVIVRAVLVSTK